MTANSDVRNNATRALLVLLESNPKLAIDIPVEWFTELLRSGTSSDLNKASYLLSSLTRNRKAEMLGQLRKREVLERLMEMARWRTHGEAYEDNSGAHCRNRRRTLTASGHGRECGRNHRRATGQVTMGSRMIGAPQVTLARRRSCVMRLPQDGAPLASSTTSRFQA